jgi:hypothetical protein
MVRLLAKISATLVALALSAVPLGVLAQSGPPGMPSYAASAPSAPANEETIHGQIASIDDAQSLQLNDDRGFIDTVQLQPGTVIRPSGSQLQPGMAVTISGVARGSVFAASHIDVAAAVTSQAGPAASVPFAPGTEVTGTLQYALDSKTAYVGENVVLTNAGSPDGSVNRATILGTVTDVTRPSQGRTAQVAIHFDSLLLPDGSRTPVDGIVISMKVKTKSNVAKEVGGALIGMLAGNALGKTLGVNGGGVVGAIGGYMIAKDNRSDVVIPANTDVTVRLVNPRRQATSNDR